MYEWLNEWMTEWMNEWMIEWTQFYGFSVVESYFIRFRTDWWGPKSVGIPACSFQAVLFLQFPMDGGWWWPKSNSRFQWWAMGIRQRVFLQNTHSLTNPPIPQIPRAGYRPINPHLFRGPRDPKNRGEKREEEREIRERNSFEFEDYWIFLVVPSRFI